MLRLISVIGIALAMVVGFLAISSQMKDDYSVRTRIVDVLKQMKALASEELQCKSSQRPDTGSNTNSPSDGLIETPQITPLVGEESARQLNGSSESNTAVDQNSNNKESPDSQAGAANPDSDSDESTEPVPVERNADIVNAMSYRPLESGGLEVSVIFNEVKGESGKTHVKPRSKIVISCSCKDQTMSCKTVESNINKNYLPKKLTKQ